MYAAVAFAGGGNRCYWQGGFWETAAPKLGLAPRLVTGASAGAWAATYCLLGIGHEVRAKVMRACIPGARNLVWSRLWKGQRPFPVAALYRELLTSVIDEKAFARINSLTDFRVSLARTPRYLPASFAALLGLGAYQLEKKLFHPVHPRFGRAIGFKPLFAEARKMHGAKDLIEAIFSAASVPPIMPLGRFEGARVVDGGMVDNVPVAPLEALEAAGEKTLVLLTRKYKKIPAIANRTYVEPSEPIPVSQFDIGNPDGIRRAYELGLKDGAAFAERMKA